jgi:hypothetical protein
MMLLMLLLVLLMLLVQGCEPQNAYSARCARQVSRWTMHDVTS